MDESRHGGLLWSFLKIGIFGFGGGYAMLPMISHEIVDIRGWIGNGEFADMVAISQMTPGPIAINAATYLGFTNGGIAGAMLATFAVCLPPFVITLSACRFLRFLKGNRRIEGAMRLLRPAVVGLVAAAALSLVTDDNFIDWRSALFFLFTMALTIWTKINPIYIVAVSGFAGWLVY